MAIISNRYLLAPLLLLAVLFGLDKIFLLPVVREHTQVWNKIEPAIYSSRQDLFVQLRHQYPQMQRTRQKLGLILGTSRAGEFDSRHFARFVPNSRTYNFSAPLAGPAFHYYWLSKLLDAGVKPDFVVVEADPVLFSPGSMRFPLAYAYDPGFMWRHLDLRRPTPLRPKDFSSVWRTPGTGFSFDETETYLLKQLFALYKYPPNPKARRKNAKTVNPFTGATGYDARRLFGKMIAKANRKNLGGIPNVLLKTRTPAEMAAQAEADARVYLQGYVASHTQVIFFRMLLRRLAERKVRTVIYWPLAPRPYRAIMERLGLVSSMQAMIRADVRALQTKYPGSRLYFVDPDRAPEIKCRHFRDSHHLSGRCYAELTNHLLRTARIHR